MDGKVGHCPRCRAWLGNFEFDNKSTLIFTEEEMLWQVFAAGEAGRFFVDMQRFYDSGGIRDHIFLNQFVGWWAILLVEASSRSAEWSGFTTIAFPFGQTAIRFRP